MSPDQNQRTFVVRCRIEARVRCRSNNPARQITMIKDRAYWEAWEASTPLREPPDFARALALMSDFLEYARGLGVFPPSDPLEGIDHKIALARRLHVGTAVGKDRAGS